MYIVIIDNKERRTFKNLSDAVNYGKGMTINCEEKDNAFSVQEKRDSKLVKTIVYNKCYDYLRLKTYYTFNYVWELIQ